MVKKEGKYWRVDITRGGVRHSTTFDTQREANSFQSQIIENFKNQRTGSIKRYTLDAAMIKWAEEELPRQKARRATANHAKSLAPYISNRFIDEIPEVWSEYKRDHHHLKPATVNRKGAILRRIANLAVDEWNWLKIRLPVKLLPENNKRQVYVTREQVEVLRSNSKGDYIKAMLKILYYTGMRISEVLESTPIDGVLVVPDTKNGKAAYIPMHDEILELTAMFPFPYTYSYYYHRFVDARNKAGMPHVHIHDIRHGTASALIKAGASLVEVRDTLRHASLQTTNRYLHLCEDGVRTAINRL